MALSAASKLTRRRAFTVASAGLAGLGFATRARADAQAVADLTKSLVGDGALQAGRITLDTPEIAENGNTVPISVEVESPMTADDHVKAVHVMAEGNPRPEVVSFRFTPANGAAQASTRMRLAKTQNVVAVAEMSDGSLWTTTNEVKVTIGGCGG